MTVTNDLNLGTIVTVAIFLIVQTGGGIWWASSIHSSVNQQGRQIAAQEEELDGLLTALNSENLRQWARINSVEDAAQSIAASNETIKAISERVERDLNQLRGEQRQTNEFLREILLANNGGEE